MKFITQISLITALLLFASGATTLSFAQSNKGGNKGKKEKPEKVTSEAKAAADSMQQSGIPDTLRNNQGAGAKGEGKKAQGKGNAYGKNKGDMSGREFGQARAAAAKKLEEEIRQLDQKVNNGEQVVRQARTEIQQAEENLENADADSTIINRRGERIAKAREQLSELETMLETQKAKLSKARNKLEEMTGSKPKADSSATGEEEEE